MEKEVLNMDGIGGWARELDGGWEELTRQKS